MKYIKNHIEFVRYANNKFDLKFTEAQINEAFQNDVTLTNSLIGQLFGWVFRKIGAKIKSSQMKSLLEELSNEFSKGQYSAVRYKNISKKNAIYSTIIGLKKLAKDDKIKDEEFGKKFHEELVKGLEEFRELIEGRGNKRIEDRKLLEITKDFYSKLNKISDNPIDLKSVATDDDILDRNKKSEDNIKDIYIDESIEPNAILLSMLEFAGGSKLDVIANNIENQLNKNVIIGDNLLKIEECNLTFNDIDRYFKALNISVELINDAIIINSYDRLSMLLEYSNTNTNKYEFLYDLNDDISSILNIEVSKKGNKIRGISVSKDTDYEEKGEDIYKAIFNRIDKYGLDFDKYSKLVSKFDDTNLEKSINNVIKFIDKFKYSRNDVSGFKSNYSNLVRSLEQTEGILKSIISRVDKDRSKFLEEEERKSTSDTTDTNVKLTWDDKGRLSINNKQFNKLGETDTTIKFVASDGSLKTAKINTNQPEEIDEEIGIISIITNNGTTVAIDGSKIREVGGIKTPNGILNRGHLEEKERRKVGEQDWKDSVDELSWLLGKEIVYNKNGEHKTVIVLDKEEQFRNKGIPGGLKVKTTDGKNTFFINDIENKLISYNGKDINSDDLLSNKDYIQSKLDSLFPDDKEYEKEMILNERDKKDLLNDIKHKAKNEETLINPLQVMKIFNKAHHKYTIENYSSIPDGKDGKGQGVNKKKNYKEMPDGSGRHVTLFKQWNEGVIDLLEQYGEYIPDKLKKFIISVLNDNSIFGKGGAQAKLLQDYFNIKVDMNDVLTGDTGKGTSTKKASGTNLYIETKDTMGKFTEPKGESLQMKKENFNKLPFIMNGQFENGNETSLVCYYLGTLNDTILFKYKENNIDFLNNYKREEQYIQEPKFSKPAKEDIRYGVMRSPKGANKDLRINDTIPIWSININLDENVILNNFKVKVLYYLVGDNDNNIMRLDTKRPGKEYMDIQPDDIREVWQKFTK